MTLHDAFQEFLTTRRLSGCTSKTIAFYEQSAGRFSNCDLDVSNAQDRVIPYFEGLLDSGISQTSIQT